MVQPIHTVRAIVYECCFCTKHGTCLIPTVRSKSYRLVRNRKRSRVRETDGQGFCQRRLRSRRPLYQHPNFPSVMWDYVPHLGKHGPSPWNSIRLKVLCVYDRYITGMDPSESCPAVPQARALPSLGIDCFHPHNQVIINDSSRLPVSITAQSILVRLYGQAHNLPDRPNYCSRPLSLGFVLASTANNHDICIIE